MEDNDHGRGPDSVGDTVGGLGGDQPGEKVTISDVVLAFMHSWFQGNNQQEIIKLAMCSFTVTQLAEATKLIMEKFPETGKYIAHRDMPGKSGSEKFAMDIL